MSTILLGSLGAILLKEVHRYPAIRFASLVLPLTCAMLAMIWGAWVRDAGSCDWHALEQLQLKEGSTALVTGANTGLGKAMVGELIGLGAAHIYMACRNMSQCKEARDNLMQKPNGVSLMPVHLDLASLASVRTLAAELSQEIGALDIVVLNAAVVRCPYTSTSDGFEMQIGVNYLGHYLLTQLLLPTIAAAQEPKIVHVSSRAAVSGTIDIDSFRFSSTLHTLYNPAASYSQSKLAQILFSNELQRRMLNEPTLRHITSNAVHPGVIMTDAGRHIMRSYGLSLPMLKPFAEMITAPFFKTLHEGALTVLFPVVSPAMQNVGGVYLGDCEPRQSTLSMYDLSLSSRLWKRSAEYVGLEAADSLLLP
jgi:NAD(P)-dependent dehydrogenase (short-subunit alcohol dehydrogenase family)